MATVSDQSGRGYAENDEFIDYQIKVARERIKWTELLTAMVLTGLLLVGYVLTFTILDHWVIAGGFAPVTRAVMLIIVLLGCSWILYRFVMRPWFRQIHPLYAAKMLDGVDTGLRGALISLVDLQSSGRAVDDGIVRTLEKRAAFRLSEVHVDEVIDRSKLIRMAGVLFVLVLATCIYAVASPKSINLLRPLTLVKSSVATTTSILVVKPGNITLPAGSHVDIVADVGGVIPEDVFVRFTTDDQRFVDEQLKMRPTEDNGRFQVVMVGEQDRGVRQSLTYQIIAGDASSEIFAVTVQQPPTSSVVQVNYEYPSYMNLPARSDNSGNIDAWQETRIAITAESTVPVETALLQFSDDASFSVKGEELPMTIRERQLSCAFTLQSREDGSFPAYYRIMVTDAEKTADPDPVVYSIKARRDEAPVVRLLDPSRDLEVPLNAVVPLLVAAEDPDFLLRSVSVHMEINGIPVQPDELLFDAFQSGLQKKWTGSWDFRVESKGVKAGDVVKYYITARDNKPPLGNMGRSNELQLRIQGPADSSTLKEQLAQDRELQERLLKEHIANDTTAPQTPIESNPNSVEPQENPGASDS